MIEGKIEGKMSRRRTTMDRPDQDHLLLSPGRIHSIGRKLRGEERDCCQHQHMGHQTSVFG